MSKGIKQIASIALPIIGAAVGGPIGAAVGGAVGGGLNGGLKGAIIGGVTGYAGAGASSALIGNSAGATLAGVTGNAAMQGPVQASGIVGALTGGGARALGAGLSSAATSAGTSPLMGLTSLTGGLMAQEEADAAEKAARIQAEAIDRGIATQQPYTQLGADAVGQIQKIQADPAGYIKNNEFYNTLAKDAERRLLANQAAKGKVGSGGTAQALQEQLLGLGNGLVNQDINRLQTQANTGVAASGNVAGMLAGQGAVNSTVPVTSNNAYQTGYQNSINTLLALQNLGKNQNRLYT